MKLPNGYGSISKLSGKRRKPYMVRISTDTKYDETTGDFILQRSILGYYATKKEAIQALAEYNEKPYNLSTKDITFEKLYHMWKEDKFKNISKQSIQCYKAAFNHSKILSDIPIRQIKKHHLQETISVCSAGYMTKKNIRSFYKQIFEYAFENDMISKNYAINLDIGKQETVIVRTVFSQEEIQRLWDNIDRMEYIDTILILIYSGMRVGELLEMQRCNVNLEERTMKIVRAKNKSSLRSVPIHNKIFPIVKKYYELGAEALIPNTEGNFFTYSNYQQKKWKQIMEQLEMEHLPHDTRHTFASLSDTYGLKKICIKRIMGHESKDITDRVYTHKDISELLEQINLIP